MDREREGGKRGGKTVKETGSGGGGGAEEVGGEREVHLDFLTAIQELKESWGKGGLF